MLIIGLLAAVCLYVVLYWIYLAAESQLVGAYSALQFINEITFRPQNDIFMLLRGLIIVTFFYIIADALLAPARRGMKKHRWRKEEAKRIVFRGAPTPKPPVDDDDDSLDPKTFAPPRFSA